MNPFKFLHFSPPLNNVDFQLSIKLQCRLFSLFFSTQLQETETFHYSKLMRRKWDKEKLILFLVAEITIEMIWIHNESDDNSRAGVKWWYLKKKTHNFNEEKYEIDNFNESRYQVSRCREMRKRLKNAHKFTVNFLMVREWNNVLWRKIWCFPIRITN